VIPPGPLVPHVMSVTDGINMLSGSSISSGSVKVTIEEAEHPESFQASIDGAPVGGLDIFCADPLPPRHEINFDVPPDLGTGPHLLAMTMGRRKLGVVTLEIVKN
jgi:hypothetical protein